MPIDPIDHTPKWSVLFESRSGDKRQIVVDADDEISAYKKALKKRGKKERIAQVIQKTKPCRLWNRQRGMYVKRNRYFDMWFDTPNEAVKYMKNNCLSFRDFEVRE